MPAPIVKPDLPSAVLRFVGETNLTVDPAFNETVAVAGACNWGPLGTDADGAETYTNLKLFEADYGTDDTPLRDAVVGAFLGMGGDAGGGAGGVIPFRMAVAASAQFASKTIQNTVPAAALVLTAVYKGVRGNRIGYTRDIDPNNATLHRLRLYLDGALVESYSYLSTDITSLQTAINARPSKYVKASAAVTGTALAAQASISVFTAGADGDVLTATEYGTMTSGLTFKQFGLFAPAGLTDAAIKVQLASWQATMAAAMRPFRLFFGGAAGETVDQAILELTTNPTLRDEHIVRLGVGTWKDAFTGKTYSTAGLAPRLAGIAAARGQKSALTRAGFAGLTPVGTFGTSVDDLRVGRDGGITMLRLVSAPSHQIAVSQGVTTFIDRTQIAKPYKLFSEPRIVGIFDQFIRDFTSWGEDKVVGDLPVTDDTRNLVRQQVAQQLDALESDGLAEPGSGFVDVTPPDDPDLEDAIPFTFGFVPTRTANFLIGNGRVR